MRLSLEARGMRAALRAVVRAIGRWAAGGCRRLGAAAAGNPGPVLFTAALATASVGFALAWVPLGLIVPGTTVCGVMIAYRWRATFGHRGDD
jgi:hypothetical protein